MNYINKFLIGTILVALLACGVGTFLRFYRGFDFIRWELYKYLLLIVAVNFLFVIFRNHSKIYIITSLFLSAFLVLLDISIIRIMYFNISPFNISIIFTIAFIALFLAKASWNITFLVNCVFIFIYVNWVALSRINFFSSYFPSPDRIILNNLNELFKSRSPGYFTLNIGIIIATISGILLLIFNKQQSSCKSI